MKVVEITFIFTMTPTPQALSGNEIRQTFLTFFRDRHHQILPSASLVPEDPTVLLTIAGMLPFKPIFLGQKTSEFPRATTSQKCIRTNDIENVGRTARHHTFFEMLGNFSFGDYFKEQAIAWAWELSTQVFGLSPEKLVVSVFEEDDEAFAIWRDQIGIPAHRIQRMGADDNFWVSGPTGPCGPCSEIYYDFHPELGDKKIDLEDDSRFIEFYNLVFMQYNRDSEGKLTPLQNKNIDTGMGLERMAQILQKVPNNYETDLIFPIIESAAKIAGIDYSKSDEKTKISLKVIGDHVRSVVHMITDGISVNTNKRGYVLRRLIRRVVYHGGLIGIEREFTTQVAETAIQLSELVYPQVRERAGFIKQKLQQEEAAFLKTLEKGKKLLEEIIKDRKENPIIMELVEGVNTYTYSPISGQEAFRLSDTYGFPLELTEEIAREEGLTVDIEEYKYELEKQRRRSKEAHETIDLTIQNTLNELAANIQNTEFLGYEYDEHFSIVKALLLDGNSVDKAIEGEIIQIILDKTPFYAESGGQVGDTGEILDVGNEPRLSYGRPDEWFLKVKIEDVKKESGIFVHFGRVNQGTIQVGKTIKAKINKTNRRRAQANHTATHLLQAALKKIVDDSISQAGSLVDFNRLRFDFNCSRAITPNELQQIEDQINHWIAEAHDTQIEVLVISEAKAKGAIAMFGEKYGAEVRVIDVPGVSMELCGGTHVNNTAEIGLFKIVSETGTSAGVRRIEAVAGPSVLEYLNLREKVVKDLSDRFKVKPEEIPERVNSLQNDLKNIQKELDLSKQELAIVKSEQLLNQAESVGEFKILVANLGEVDAESLKTAAERLQQKLGEGAVILGSIPEADKVSLVAAFSPQVIKTKQLQAGKFIGNIAKICGGGGGGRPNLAQAGGRDPSKLTEALETAENQLRSLLQ